ncbi:hypothetical protein AT705_08985 [Pseudoalteromonas rubra]|uniref:Uncharacterized protein n=1 Tax=Pseudoalteromonas rubra TaxID=43658 RepID=A0A0U3HP90_9GAMM|nr:hypothetical protein AT705_08985 [Pseudoalteromonas rubra]
MVASDECKRAVTCSIYVEESQLFTDKLVNIFTSIGDGEIKNGEPDRRVYEKQLCFHLIFCNYLF